MSARETKFEMASVMMIDAYPLGLRRTHLDLLNMVLLTMTMTMTMTMVMMMPMNRSHSVRYEYQQRATCFVR
jgi:hypothetical protein